ncbi:phytanoyl-CoA dioxygenase family protein [uncultured Roseibium sp.]|uniref:phytanoyl-CoA dioxygenase family protein n=1 Tax=uncultured Roseibium sp. TaxID=1936171 RepID=UPI0026267B07|nr:phytanoyl-CoA dioxygenase family protein [uncultured Roseibium sp.]
MGAQEVRLSSTASPDEILDVVKAAGGCIVPNFLDKATTEAMRDEFDYLMENTVENVDVHADAGYSIAKRALFSDVDEGKFPVIRDVVANRGFKDISTRYYDDVVDYPSKLFFVRSIGRPDEVVTALPYVMHFDRHQFLKYAILLTDVTEEDGPTWIVPGRTQEFREKRLEMLNSSEITPGENVLSDFGEEVALTGPAGSLAIFDTDAPHRAGNLEPGRVRKLLRIDTEGERSRAQSERRVPKKKGFFSKLRKRFGT